jgi:hypothetical protein
MNARPVDRVASRGKSPIGRIFRHFEQRFGKGSPNNVASHQAMPVLALLIFNIHTQRGSFACA